MNASASAAAVAATLAANAACSRGHSPQGLQESSSFNPYRYFANASSSEYTKSADSPRKQFLGASMSAAGSPLLQRRSPQKPSSPFAREG